MCRTLIIVALAIAMQASGDSIKQSAWQLGNSPDAYNAKNWQASGFQSWRMTPDCFIAECSGQNSPLFSPELEINADQYEYLDIFYHQSGGVFIDLYFSHDGKAYPNIQSLRVEPEQCETFYPARKTIRMKNSPEWKGIIKKLQFYFINYSKGSTFKLYGFAFRNKQDTLKNGIFLLNKNSFPEYWQKEAMKGNWQIRTVMTQQQPSGKPAVLLTSTSGGTAEISTDLPHIRQNDAYEASLMFSGNGRLDAVVELADRSGRNIAEFPLKPGSADRGWTTYQARYVPTPEAYSGKLKIKVSGDAGSNNQISECCVEYLGSPDRWKGQWLWLTAQAENDQTGYFRKEFEVDEPARYASALLQCTCDDQFDLNINGKLAASSSNWSDPQVVEVLSSLRKGKNTISIIAHNNTSAAGLLVELKLIPKDNNPPVYIASDKTWLCCATAPEPGWEYPGFNAAAGKWLEPFSLGCPPKAPWGGIAYAVKPQETLPKIALDRDKYRREKTVCKIDNALNYPRLAINSQIITPVIFGTRFHGNLDKSLNDSVKGGFNLYRIFFEFTEAWRPDGTFDSAGLDAMVENCLSANPNAYIIMPFRISAPGWWMKKNPDELCLFSDKSTNGWNYVLPSTASEKWKEEAGRIVRIFMEHVEKQWYSSRIIGYMPCSHSGPEWVICSKSTDYPDYSKPMQEYFRNFIRRKYDNKLELLRHAWKNPQITFESVQVPAKERRDNPAIYILDPLRFQDVIDFNRCLQESDTDAIMSYLKIIRACAPDKLNVLYYGYLATMAQIGPYPVTSGHYDLMRILESELVDMFASPASYIWRKPGDISGCGSVESSYRLHKVLWLHEADNRSNLTQDAFGHKNSLNLRDSINENRREFVYAMLKRQAIWFFDMAGGWYGNPAYYDDFKMLHKLYDYASRQPLSWQTPVAVFFDEKSMDGLSLNRAAWSGMNPKRMQYQFMRGLAMSGTPYDTFELNDLYKVNPDNYKCYIFVNAWRYDEKLMQYLKEKIYKNGNTAIWIYAPGAGQSAAGVEGMSAMTGISFIRDQSGNSLAYKLETVHPWFRSGEFYNYTGGISGIRPPDVYAINDSAAEVLGRYPDSGKNALVLKRLADHNIIYMPSPDDSGRIWRQIFRQLGIHIFINRADRVCFDGKFLAVSLLDGPGERTVSLPSSSEVWDVFTRKQVSSSCQEFKFNGKPGDVMLYYLGNIKELQ